MNLGSIIISETLPVLCAIMLDMSAKTACAQLKGESSEMNLVC